jgi:tRNA pseudouridine55 synthase
VIDGVVIVNKPKGMTSRDVVNKVSKILHTKKIGHTGTLDPIASGVLALTVGKATKLSEVITSEEKEYVATAILGLETDTLDTEGTIIKDEDTYFNKEDILNVLNSFKTTYLQEVPIYSAVKINGMKLYDYARKGIDVNLPKREVCIKEISLIDIKYENNKTIIKFSCLVSKGTYIRSLIRDIASKLNTVGIMCDLERTKQGTYDIKNACTLANIEKGNFKYLSLEEVLKDYYTIDMDSSLEFKVKNGCVLDNAYNKDYVLFRSNNILALYKNDENKLKPFKMFL